MCENVSHDWLKLNVRTFFTPACFLTTIKTFLICNIFSDPLIE
jgi:hypothetical protein